MEATVGQLVRSSSQGVDALLVSRIVSPVVLVTCSTRAATLTVSPMSVNSSLLPPPMVPAITLPGVDADADAQCGVESLGAQAMDQPSGIKGSIRVIRQIIRRAVEKHRAAARSARARPSSIEQLIANLAKRSRSPVARWARANTRAGERPSPCYVLRVGLYSRHPSVCRRVRCRTRGAARPRWRITRP